jgi:trk system potassium uptake protein TrkA
MKIVIIGDGKVGKTLTQELAREGHDLMVIDSRKDALTQVEEHMDVMVMQANGASVEVQRQAGVPNCDLMIAATSADEVNFICCMIARKLGCKHTIARSRSPEYEEALNLLRDELGLSMAVNPEKSAAREILGLLQYPSFLKRDVFAKGRAEIVGIPVHAGSKLDGMALQTLYKALRVHLLVCAVERGEDVVIPDGSFVLRAGDHAYVTAPAQELFTLVKGLELSTTKVHDVLIVGGGRIAFYLTQMLSDMGVRVKIIENNLERCNKLSAELPTATVVCADGTSFQTLAEEGIDETDAVVTLTDLDEQNLIVSMYANLRHVPKVVTKINRTEYEDILRKTGTDCVVTPKMLVAYDILRYVRAMENRQGDNVIALHRMLGGRVEALEFRVSANTVSRGIPLKNLQVVPGILVAIINHKGSVFVPGGNDRFLEGDTVVLVTTTGRKIDSLNDVLSVK